MYVDIVICIDHCSSYSKQLPLTEQQLFSRDIRFRFICVTSTTTSTVTTTNNNRWFRLNKLLKFSMIINYTDKTIRMT